MSTLQCAKSLGLEHNVMIRVLDASTGRVVNQHRGHNAATNSMLLGIAHYLKGDGVMNQGHHMLSAYVPKYISLGTMGLINQDEDADGLPAGVGIIDGSESDRFTDYMLQCPGYGADGYDPNANNNRPYDGLGLPYGQLLNPSDPQSAVTTNCELISPSFPRALISYRDVIPETEAELPQTIDVVFSAMISTGALAQFRAPGKDYIFITEAGLWSKRDWTDGGDNGLLAGYRIAPPNQSNWDMSVSANRQILKENIIRVGINQVVQVIWKIQIGGLPQLAGMN